MCIYKGCSGRLSGAGRWTESIAQRVKRKKKVEDNSKKEIWHSVFEPPYVASVTYSGPVSSILPPCYSISQSLTHMRCLGQDS